MNLQVLLYDVYFWAAVVLFLLSAAGIFWILRSMQGESGEVIIEPDADTPEERLARIEDSIAKIEKKIADHNPDQMNEMAGQMKLIVQMLKTIGSSENPGGGDPALQQKVDKIYQILSTLSRTEVK